MFLRPKSLVLRYGRYSESFRKKDEEAIENLYESNGFQNGTVSLCWLKRITRAKKSDLGVVLTHSGGSAVARWLAKD